MANLGRILRLEDKLLSGKSRSEIEVMVKQMMVRHYNNAIGSYKKNELSCYVFYDLSGNATRFSLEDLGLTGVKKLKAEVTDDYRLPN